MTSERAGVSYCDTCGGQHDHNHRLGRLGWAVTMTRHGRPKSLVARLRLVWHDFVLHGLLDRGGERCEDCGRSYGHWQATDWDEVVSDSGGLLCPPCFEVRRG